MRSRSRAWPRPPVSGRAAQIERPFRSPQHTASIAAIIGGSSCRPGELSLAHHGVLFLDELPEFSRNVLEALREPLESGVVVVGRARRTCEYPAGFQLIAAMNPCPCGYAGESGRCRCTPGQLARYRRRISGPLIDRIDMHIELAAVPVEHLMAGDDPTGEPSPVRTESSAAIAARVAAARRMQIARQGTLNARLGTRAIGTVCSLDRESRALVAAAIDRLGLSARAYHRVLKIARTCADLAAEARIRRSDVSEAIGLRALDRARPGRTLLGERNHVVDGHANRRIRPGGAPLRRHQALAGNRVACTACPCLERCAAPRRPCRRPWVRR